MLTWFLRGGRKVLSFSVWIGISFSFFAGIEIDMILEWGSNWPDFSSGHELVFCVSYQM